MMSVPLIPRPPLPGGPYLVVGLARSGVAVAQALAIRGETVLGCDARPVSEADGAALRAARVAVHAPDDGVGLLDGVATLVKSPGVPQEAPVVAAARERGLTVVGELEIAWRLLPNRWIAITGSNGKTTTSELAGHIWRSAGAPAVVAGNVGTAVSSLIGSLPPDRTILCEASSFQLEDTLELAPEAAVLLNLAEDHLDRHHTVAAYHAAKLQAFARQPRGALAIAPSEPIELGGQAERVRFGDVIPGVGDEPALSHADGILSWRGEPLIAAAEIRIRGPHNRENAMAAAALALAWGLPADAVRAALRSFPGVPHRLEEIATVAGILYVNDSKATNVDAAMTAVRSFPRGVHLILGGRGKGASYSPLRTPIAERCSAVYLIGEDAPAIRADLGDDVGPPIADCGDLERAVAEAGARADEGDVVLLSPACASYDQYESYAARGDHFRALVNARPATRRRRSGA